MLYSFLMHYSSCMIYNCYHKGDKTKFRQFTVHYIYKPINKYRHRLAASEIYQETNRLIQNKLRSAVM